MSDSEDTGPVQDSGHRRRWSDTLPGRENRPLMAHGPIVRLILVLNALGLVAAVAAFVLVVVLFQDKIDANSVKVSAIQQSRVLSARDTCEEFRFIIAAAESTSPKAEQNPRREKAFLIAAGLDTPKGKDNCGSRAANQVALNH